VGACMGIDLHFIYGRLNLDVNNMGIYLHFGLTQPHKDCSRN